jgi:ribonuclease P protein component
MPGVVMQARPQAADLRDTDPATVARVGFTVSKKVGNAVERNRAKRRLRAAAADVLTVSAAPGIDYVLIGRRQTLERPYAALKQDLEAALARLDAQRAGEPVA